MNKENNFEVKNIDLEEMNNVVEIKDEEMKSINGGRFTLGQHIDDCENH